MRTHKKILTGVCIAALLSGGNALAQDNDTAVDEERTLDAITVTGIRGSLDRALAVKENSDVIVDAISAEELGKFPDQNVAESAKASLLPFVALVRNLTR